MTRCGPDAGGAGAVLFLTSERAGRADLHRDGPAVEMHVEVAGDRLAVANAASTDRDGARRAVELHQHRHHRSLMRRASTMCVRPSRSTCSSPPLRTMPTVRTRSPIATSKIIAALPCGRRRASGWPPAAAAVGDRLGEQVHRGGNRREIFVRRIDRLQRRPFARACDR